jgi:hypothetical protein
MKKYSIFIYLILLSFNNLTAQEFDYSDQITAIEQAFNKKEISDLQRFLSDDLKFPPLPADKTQFLLSKVFKNFPKLDSLQTIKVEEGYALVKYYFKGSRGTESKLYFGTAGKITRIRLIEKVLEREMENGRSVPKPNPGALAEKFPFKPVTINSKDGLVVHGNLFEVDPEFPTILLCHQGSFNKFEYADIAPKLNQLGFNCLAIDQRSGGSFANHNNETHNLAVKENFDTDFLEAEKDIETAINYLYKRYNKKVTVWGSSYSSILSLFLANNVNLNAIIAFSPSDFFKDERPMISEVISNIEKPYFITSSKGESKILIDIMKTIDQKSNQLHFVPKSLGFHGSRSLWENQIGAKEYWDSLKKFLELIK